MFEEGTLVNIMCIYVCACGHETEIYFPCNFYFQYQIEMEMPNACILFL
jgi:hypothetical protein